MMNIWREMLRPPRDRPIGVSLLGWWLFVSSIQALVTGLGFLVLAIANQGEPLVTTGGREWLDPYLFLLTIPPWAGTAFQMVFGVVYLTIGSGLLRVRPWARTAGEIAQWYSVAIIPLTIWFVARWIPLPPEIPRELFRMFMSGVLVFAGLAGTAFAVFIALYLRRPKVRKAFRPT